MARESVGQLIRRYRGEMSQERLAVTAGTDSKAVGQIEAGTRDAGFSTIARLLAILEVPADEIHRAIRYELDEYARLPAAARKGVSSPKDLRADNEMRATLARRRGR